MSAPRGLPDSATAPRVALDRAAGTATVDGVVYEVRSSARRSGWRWVCRGQRRVGGFCASMLGVLDEGDGECLGETTLRAIAAAWLADDDSDDGRGARREG